MTYEEEMITRFIEDGRGRHTFGADGRQHHERFGETGEALRLVAKYSSLSDDIRIHYAGAMSAIEQALQEPGRPPTASKATFEKGVFDAQQECLGLLFEHPDVPMDDKIRCGQLRSQYK